MAECLWFENKRMKAMAHRLIWWLLDVGAPGHILQTGWQMACAKELGLSRYWVRKQVDILVEEGILVPAQPKGEYLMQTGVFQKRARKELVRMMRRGQK